MEKIKEVRSQRLNKGGDCSVSPQLQCFSKVSEFFCLLRIIRINCVERNIPLTIFCGVIEFVFFRRD